MSDIHDRFHDVLDLFYEKNHYLAGQISKLGYPKMITGYPPTAGVLWNKEQQKIEFLFNSEFFKKINDQEFQFAVAHEAGHVINGHVFLMKSEIDRLKAQGADQKEISKFTHKFNKAADCVINDSLVNLYGLERCEFLDEKGKCTIVYGKDLVGCHCHDLSVIDVMALIPEDKPSSGSSHDTWDSFFNKDGSLDRSFVDSMKDFVEDNQDNAALAESDLEDLEDLQESMKDCSDSYARQAGRSADSNRRKVAVQQASLYWDRILFRKVDKRKVEDSWSRRSRKFAAFSSDLLLPSTKSKESEEIFVAIDVSASIDWEALELFVSLVRNTPKHFKITAITFNTSCLPHDITSDQVRSGGGTRFDIIEKYIQDNLKNYPKAVFVLTDGDGNSVYPQHPNRWVWLLYGCCRTVYCKGMSHYNLEGLLK